MDIAFDLTQNDRTHRNGRFVSFQRRRFKQGSDSFSSLASHHQLRQEDLEILELLSHIGQGWDECLLNKHKWLDASIQQTFRQGFGFIRIPLTQGSIELIEKISRGFYGVAPFSRLRQYLNPCGLIPGKLDDRFPAIPDQVRGFPGCTARERIYQDLDSPGGVRNAVDNPAHIHLPGDGLTPGQHGLPEPGNGLRSRWYGPAWYHRWRRLHAGLPR